MNTPQNHQLLHLVAKGFSVLGHPLLITALFIVFATFQQSDRQGAFLVSAILIGGVILPVTFINYRKAKKGEYTNFDVSDRKQRSSMYVYMLVLLTVATFVLFITGQDEAYCYGILCFLIMLLAAYLLNFWIKASLHSAIAFYLSFCMMELNSTSGLIMLLLAMLVSISRLILKRHTIAEVLSGMMLGCIAGYSAFLILSNL